MAKWRRAHLALFTMFAAVATAAGPGNTPADDAGLPPVPVGAEVGAARQAVLTELKADLSLDGPALRVRACEKFMAIAGASGGDLVRRYAALAECQRYAEGHGLGTQAVAAIDEMAKWWGFGRYERIRKSLDVAAGNCTTKEMRESLADVAKRLADEAAGMEKWEAAAGLIKVAESAADRSGNRALSAEMAADANAIDAGRREMAEVAQYAKKLQTDPNDVRANQAMGEYLCVARHQLGKGMVHLSRGMQGQVRDAAASELENSMYMGKGASMGLAGQWSAAALTPGLSKGMKEFCLGLAVGHDMEAMPEMTAVERGPAVTRISQWMNAHVTAGQNYGSLEPTDDWKGLGRVRFQLREDGDDLVTYQGQLMVERLPAKADLPAAKYTLYVLAVDPTGKGLVFKAGGKVVWPKEVEKPARMSGPKRKTVKEMAPPKSKVVAAYVKVDIEGKPVFQAVSTMPVDRPWWLMPDLLAPER